MTEIKIELKTSLVESGEPVGYCNTATDNDGNGIDMAVRLLADLRFRWTSEARQVDKPMTAELTVVIGDKGKTWRGASDLDGQAVVRALAEHARHWLYEVECES